MRSRSRSHAARKASQGKCAKCGQAFEALEVDHIVPLALGGADAPENLEALCPGCHRAKTQRDVKQIAKAKRLRDKRLGIPRGRWKRKVGGGVVRE